MARCWKDNETFHLFPLGCHVFFAYSNKRLRCMGLLFSLSIPNVFSAGFCVVYSMNHTYTYNLKQLSWKTNTLDSMRWIVSIDRTPSVLQKTSLGLLLKPPTYVMQSTSNISVCSVQKAGREVYIYILYFTQSESTRNHVPPTSS